MPQLPDTPVRAIPADIGKRQPGSSGAGRNGRPSVTQFLFFRGSLPSLSLPTKLKRKHRTADISGIEIVRREFYASATAAVLSGLHLHG